MERKICQLNDMKLDDAAGTVVALFSRFGTVDKQGDLTLPGAFGEQRVIISAYGHGSWSGALPVGKGRIYETAEGGVLEGQFNLKIGSGKETYEAVKFTGDLQEWSYALPEIDFEYREQDGKRIRVLKRIRVNEVSPVLLGAGDRTQTLAIKSDQVLALIRAGLQGSVKLVDHVELVAEAAASLIKRLADVASKRESQGEHVGEATMQRVLGLRAKLAELVSEVDQIVKEHSAVERVTLEALEIINRYRR